MKYDLFKLLKDINSKNVKSENIKLSDEDFKEFSPYLVQRWLSGVDDEIQILLLNEISNPYIFNCDKDLSLELLKASSSKRNNYSKWIPINSTNKIKNKNLIQKVVCEYLNISTREYKELFVFPTNNEIISWAEELGYQKEEITLLKKEISK